MPELHQGPELRNSRNLHSTSRENLITCAGGLLFARVAGFADAPQQPIVWPKCQQSYQLMHMNAHGVSKCLLTRAFCSRISAG